MVEFEGQRPMLYLYACWQLVHSALDDIRTKLICSKLHSLSQSQSPLADDTPSVSSPVPSNLSNVNTEGDRAKNSFGGMNPTKKVGIVLGMIVGVGMVGLAGFVYKKREDSIRRSQYGYAARREIL